MSQPRRSRSPLSKAGLAVAVIAVLAAGWYFWSKRGQADVAGGYRTEAVQRGDIRVAISSTGTLSAITTVTVGSQISGQVTEILVDFNSLVKKGDVLAGSIPPPIRRSWSAAMRRSPVRRPSCARRRPPCAMPSWTISASRS